MCEIVSPQNLRKLKHQLEAWDTHLSEYGLEDRRRFIAWLMARFSPRELALSADSETDRQTLWRTYLRDRYGP